MAINSSVILGGVGAVALGTIGGLYFGSTAAMSSWRALSWDNEFWNEQSIHSDYNNKYGGTYGHFLVGVGTPLSYYEEIRKGNTTEIIKKEATPKSNDSWWNWSYKNRYVPVKEKTQGAFANLNDANALKDKCAAAYKQEINTGSGNGKIKITQSGSIGGDEYLEENIWLFCSPAKEKIKSVTDEGATDPAEYVHNNTLGGDDETVAKKDLVSTVSKSEGNKWFWEWMDGRITSAVRKVLNMKSGKTIKSWCSEAYKKEGTLSAGAFTKEKMFTYCSLSGDSPNAINRTKKK